MISNIMLEEKKEALVKRKMELEQALSQFQNRLTALAQERIAVIGQIALLDELMEEAALPNKIKQKIEVD